MERMNRQPVDVMLSDCFEAQAYYNSLRKDIPAYAPRPSRSMWRLHNVIAEAYLMRSETLLANS